MVRSQGRLLHDGQDLVDDVDRLDRGLARGDDGRRRTTGAGQGAACDVGRIIAEAVHL